MEDRGWLNCSLLFFRSCPVSSHHLILTNEEWHLLFSCFPPFDSHISPQSLIPFLHQTLHPFSSLHSPHFCLTSSSLFSCRLIISALSFLLHFSSVSSSWPLFPALNWFIVEFVCCYFRNCKKAHILNVPQQCECFCLCLSVCKETDIKTVREKRDRCDLICSETLSAV